jgi:alpha-L-fucosidase
MRTSRHALVSSVFTLALIFSWTLVVRAQAPAKYEPTLDSLNHHPLPQWYSDAKLGIFIHWGLYSVPGWAPLVHPNHDFTSLDYIKNNPYAEWYLNTVRIEGSLLRPIIRALWRTTTTTTSPHLRQETQKWNPDAWAEFFRNGSEV